MTQNGRRGRSPEGGPSSFFASRLRAPANPVHYLRRPRLLSLLARSTSVPITVVVAPAGSGKTSLLVDWRSSAAVPTAWLSVDESDRDGGQFWSAVTAALGELVDLGTVQSSTRRPAPRPDVVPGIVARLERCDHPASAVLVLDDIHLLDDDDTLVDSLAQFLAALPDWLHVVLLTRRTPKLPIDRLRARGQLVEVHFAELRFSPEESQDMLACLQASLGHDEVSTAVDRAGGWAAGLQLTALASRSDSAQPVSLPRVDARGLLFADYVWREVLAAERPEVVDVLLDTSVVVRTNGALAAALSGRSDAGDLLADAEARGLFITRLGPSGWFEVHAVVRQELLAEVGAAHARPRRHAARAGGALVRGRGGGAQRARAVDPRRPAARGAAGAGREGGGAVRLRPDGDHREDHRADPPQRGLGRPRRDDRVRLVPPARGQAPVPRGGRRGEREPRAVPRRGSSAGRAADDAAVHRGDAHRRLAVQQRPGQAGHRAAGRRRPGRPGGSVRLEHDRARGGAVRAVGRRLRAAAGRPPGARAGTRSGGWTSRAPVRSARRSPVVRWTRCGSRPGSAASRRSRPWRSSARS